MSTLYENIIELANELGFSGSFFFENAGIDKSSLSNLKSGRVKRLSSKNLERLSTTYGIPMDWILHGKPADAKMPSMRVRIKGIEFDDGTEKGIKKESAITDGLSEIDLETIELIKRMSDEDRKRLANFAKALLASEPQD